jgi:hypothetical protein
VSELISVAGRVRRRRSAAGKGASCMEEGADAKNARSAVTTLINMLQNGPCKGKVGWTDSLYQLTRGAAS